MLLNYDVCEPIVYFHEFYSPRIYICTVCSSTYYLSDGLLFKILALAKSYRINPIFSLTVFCSR